MDKGLPYNRDCLLGSRKDPFKPRAAMGGAFSLRVAGHAPRMAHRASGRDGANLQRSSPMQRRMRFTLSLPRARLGTKGQGVHPR
jgi:hypothetical protein